MTATLGDLNSGFSVCGEGQENTASVIARGPIKSS